MIKGWNYLTVAFALLTCLFVGILAYGDINMFTFPVTMAFLLSTVYCAQQWHVTKLFKKIEAKNPKWKI